MSWLLLTDSSKNLVNLNRAAIIYENGNTGGIVIEYEDGVSVKYKEKFEDVKEFIRQLDSTLALQLGSMENSKNIQDNKFIKRTIFTLTEKELLELAAITRNLENENKLKFIKKDIELDFINCEFGYLTDLNFTKLAYMSISTNLDVSVIKFNNDKNVCNQARFIDRIREMLTK